MSDNGERFPVLSVHLSRVLDDIGLNKLTVRRRREAYLFTEQYETLMYRTLGKQLTTYSFGSQVEGTTTQGLASDIDTLYCYDEYNVMQDMSDWKQDKRNLLMLQEDTAPGYCRLQLPGPHVPDRATEDMPNDTFLYDRHNRVILKHTVFCQTPEMQQLEVRNGPARSIRLLGSQTADTVHAFRCNAWPREAVSWAQKHSRGNWPEQSLIDKAVNSGFFLVPVGYKLSETENLEWIISLSLTERLLMFSMNMTQLKCYVVLKIIMKSLVIPNVGESISSYHCKTALFYCSEDTGTDFWMEDNLFQCVTRCLSLLLRWVRDEYCPHFIMPESNLFAGKLNACNKHKLLSALESMMESSGQFLFDISTDGLGDKLRLRCSAPPTRIPFTDSPNTMAIIFHAEIFKISSTECKNTYLILHHYAKVNRVEAIALVRGQLAAVHERTNHAENYKGQMIIVLREMLSCLLGSLLASDLLSCKREVSQEAFSLLHRSAENNNANVLKLASVLFCDGYLEKAEEVLQEVESKYKRKCMHPVCHHVTSYIISNADLDLISQLVTQQDEVARLRLFGPCVAFSVHELHCAPPALRYELFRSVGDDCRQRAPTSVWMDLAVADFLPFLYYLQYLTYGLRKPDLQRRALNNLEQCIKDNYNFGHLETAWNLLGQCMEAENNPVAALDCYSRSLVVRPRDNAANWHLSILVYKEIKATYQT